MTKTNIFQIQIKQSALYLVPDPLDYVALNLIEYKELNSNGEVWTYDKAQKVWDNIETSFRKYGRGGIYTLTIKTQDELRILEDMLEGNLSYIETQNMFREENADSKMEEYLSDKMNEIKRFRQTALDNTITR